MSELINPPNLAIALKYDGLGAPRVTAKGKGIIAEQILELAKQHGIPLHGDPQLARLLANVPLGDEIPRELYVAISEVIAFADLLSAKRPGT